MADDNILTEDERIVWELIQARNFEIEPWDTPKISEELRMDEDRVYEALAGVAKKLKDDVYIYYRGGAIRLAKREG